MASNKHHNELGRRFVDYLNRHDFEPMAPDHIPAAMRGPAHEVMSDWFTWKIMASTSNSWVVQLEEKLPRRYPGPFHSLISDYRFCEFEVGPILFFANTGEDVWYELSKRVFADKHMSPFLLQKGYLQFGQAAGGHYDPICFAPRGLKDKRESRIVRLDHEEILINNRIKIRDEVATSVEDFMERAISAEFEVH